jgi:hypothetical protein
VAEIEAVDVVEGERRAVVRFVEMEADVHERDLFGKSYIEPIYG